MNSLLILDDHPIVADALSELVTDTLKELRKFEPSNVQQNLIIDTQKQFPVCIPFNPSSIGLETIELPEPMGLGFLKKI